MSKSGSQTLDDRIYAILTDHLGERWDPFWLRLRKSFENEESVIARSLKNRIWRQVVTSVFVEIKLGKAVYFDKSVKELWEAPLEFGQLFINPISEKLSMVGYEPPVTSTIGPTSTTRVVGFQSTREGRDDRNRQREPRNQRIRQITPAVYFCKGFDWNWYEVRYTFILKKEFFEGGIENFGHIDFLLPEEVSKAGVKIGYTKTMLNDAEIAKYSLSKAS